MGVMEIPEIRNQRHNPFVDNITQLPRATADLRSQLSALDFSGEVTILGDVVSYTSQYVPLGETVTCAVISLLVDGTPMTLGFDGDLRAVLGDKLTPHDLKMLPPEVLAIAVEHLLTNDLIDFEEERGLRVEICDITLGTRFETRDVLASLALTSDNGPSGVLYIWAKDNEALVKRLIDALPQKPPRALPQIKIPAAFVGPVACMPKATVAALNEGDVLELCQKWYDLADNVNLLVRNEYLLPLRHVTTGFSASGPDYTLTHIRETFEDGVLMSPSNPNSPDSFVNPVTTVTVELKRTELSVAALAEIQEGVVIDFDIKAVDVVRICAEGAPVAEGQLVKLDDVYCVQVTKLL